jgi:hypothetical protein
MGSWQHGSGIKTGYCTPGTLPERATAHQEHFPFGVSYTGQLCSVAVSQRNYGACPRKTALSQSLSRSQRHISGIPARPGGGPVPVPLAVATAIYYQGSWRGSCIAVKAAQPLQARRASLLARPWCV